MLSSKVHLYRKKSESYHLGYWNNYSHCNEAPSRKIKQLPPWRPSERLLRMLRPWAVLSAWEVWPWNISKIWTQTWSPWKSTFCCNCTLFIRLELDVNFGFQPRKSLVFIHLILLTCYSVVCRSHRNLSDSTLPKMASPLLMSSLLGAFPHFFLVYYPPCIIIFWEPCTSSCFFWPMVLFTASSKAKFLSSSECSSAKDLGSELDVKQQSRSKWPSSQHLKYLHWASLEKDGKKSFQATDLDYLVMFSTTIIQLLELLIIWSPPVQQWIVEIKNRTLGPIYWTFLVETAGWKTAQRYIIPCCFKLLGIGLDLSHEVSFHLLLCCLAKVESVKHVFSNPPFGIEVAEFITLHFYP